MHSHRLQLYTSYKIHNNKSNKIFHFESQTRHWNHRTSQTDCISRVQNQRRHFSNKITMHSSRFYIKRFKFTLISHASRERLKYSKIEHTLRAHVANFTVPACPKYIYPPPLTYPPRTAAKNTHLLRAQQSVNGGPQRRVLGSI